MLNRGEQTLRAVTGSGGRLQIGMVAGIKSERWPTSNRNSRPDCLGIRTLGTHALRGIASPLLGEASRRGKAGRKSQYAYSRLISETEDDAGSPFRKARTNPGRRARVRPPSRQPSRHGSARVCAPSPKQMRAATNPSVTNGLPACGWHSASRHRRTRCCCSTRGPVFRLPSPAIFVSRRDPARTLAPSPIRDQLHRRLHTKRDRARHSQREAD